MTAMASVPRVPNGPVRRPAAGVEINPVRYREIREARMSRAQLARRAGCLMFTADMVTRIETGKLASDELGARVLQLLYAVLHGTRPEPGLAVRPDQVRGLREKKGWSREKLADEVGQRFLSRDAIAKHETGARFPKADTLQALCTVLECDPRDLKVKSWLDDIPALDARDPLFVLRSYLPARVYDSLTQAGYTTVGEIAAALEAGELAEIPGFDRSQLPALGDVLAAGGLLGQDQEAS